MRGKEGTWKLKKVLSGCFRSGGKDGLLLTITPIAGETWIGSFTPGHPGHITKASHELSQSEQDLRVICVISSGAGYIVQVDSPSNWKSVRSIPVWEQVLVLSDFTKLVAYGVDSPKWESPKISSDGIQISDIAGGHLGLVGWDAAQTKEGARFDQFG